MYVVRDVANPLNLPHSSRLEEPRANTPESQEVTNFFRLMDGLSAKEFM